MDNRIVSRIKEIYNEWQDDYIMEIAYGSDEGYDYIKGAEIYEKGNDEYRMLAFNNTDLEWYGFLISTDLGFFEALMRYMINDPKSWANLTFKVDVRNMRSQFSNIIDKDKWLLEMLWIKE